MASEFKINIPARLNVESAEKVLESVSSGRFKDEIAHIDFRECTHIDIGAGYRVGNVLRAISEHARLRVSIAAEDFIQSPSRRWFLNFTRSGLGPAIAEYAQEVSLAGRNIREELIAYYRRTLHVPTQNTVYFTGLHLGRLDVEDESRFVRNLLAQFRFLNVSAKSFDEQSLSSLGAMCFEAAQNVVDHAARKPMPPGSKIFSYLSLRYYKGSDRPEEGVFARYLRHVNEKFGSEDDVRYIEIVVNDDGVGIPARESQALDIYRGAKLTEEAALSNALKHSKLKLRAKDSQVRGGVTGQGYKRIQDGLKQLGAFASLRTGRSLVSFNGLSPIQTEFVMMPGSFGQSFALMPGTALQIVVPFRPISNRGNEQRSLF